jgi:hypothetical protein
MDKDVATKTPPAIESQMLRGMPSRKRSFPERKCTTAKPTAARSETTMVVAFINPRSPPGGCH